jgi:hypothetical protein
MQNERIFKMPFASVYTHYIDKVVKKGKSKEEVHKVIFWLTSYNENQLQQIIAHKTNFQDFFSQAPTINPNATKIKGVICGYRVEEIENKLMQQIRYLDKLIDEVAQGKALDKILRK